MATKLDKAMSSIMAKLEATVATALGSDGESSCYSPKTPPDFSPATEAAKEARRRGLKFSIDNILKPEFGSSPSNSSTSTESSRLSLLNSSTDSSNTSQISRPLATKPSPVVDMGTSPRFKSPPLSPASPKSITSSATPPTPGTGGAAGSVVWPAWVYCTRYSDRPSSGPRCRKVKRKAPEAPKAAAAAPEGPDEKRPRTAFSAEQLGRLKAEFGENRYLTEKRRQELAHSLGLNESQIKIWFQNKRAKMKKQTGLRNPLAFALMTQGLYNHATVPVTEDGAGTEQEESS